LKFYDSEIWQDLQPFINLPINCRHFFRSVRSNSYMTRSIKEAYIEETSVRDARMELNAVNLLFVIGFSLRTEPSRVIFQASQIVLRLRKLVYE
jgi:hypothetical protein